MRGSPIEEVRIWLYLPDELGQGLIWLALILILVVIVGPALSELINGL